VPGGFSFNQYLIADDEPLLFHTGPRRMFPLVREAIASVLPVERLRFVGFSHVEADECGSLNEMPDYYAHAQATRALLEKVAATRPRTLACMHGSAWSGDGERLILELADAVAPERVLAGS
jgi:hypothetical protein